MNGFYTPDQAVTQPLRRATLDPVVAAPPGDRALDRLYRRLEAIAGNAAGVAMSLTASVDSLVGAEPEAADASKPPQPSGRLWEMDVMLDILERHVFRIGAQVDRLNRI